MKFERSNDLSYFTTDERYHEDSTKTQNYFFEKRQRFSKVVNEFGNPFLVHLYIIYFFQGSC